jgi:hypothetical protein
VQSLGLRVWAEGLMVPGYDFRVYPLGFSVKSVGLIVREVCW